jgi:N-succinyldiaminopimelate aminotransferase
LLYRTYHGSAMGPVVQAASVAAWSDELHVVDNRTLYRRKFAQVTPLLAQALDVQLPDAGFYLWAAVPPAWGGSCPVWMPVWWPCAMAWAHNGPIPRCW